MNSGLAFYGLVTRKASRVRSSFCSAPSRKRSVRTQCRLARPGDPLLRQLPAGGETEEDRECAGAEDGGDALSSEAGAAGIEGAVPADAAEPGQDGRRREYAADVDETGAHHLRQGERPLLQDGGV